MSDTDNPEAVEVKPGYAVATRLFLRALGLVYLAAFISLWSQIHGLVGSEGILPVTELLELARQKLGPHAYWEIPTLAWLGSSDAALDIICGAGVVTAAAAIVLPLWVLPWPALWALYLSLYYAGQRFMTLQWDILLLETGFLAIWLVPMNLLPIRRRPYEPPKIVVWLYAWLFFRFLCASGVVKITFGDTTWQDLTALTFHYQTQPLPPWTAWYMHHLPVWFHKASCLLMYFIEVQASALVFPIVPRPLRVFGFLCQLFLQLVIIATGNYGFFNYLTIALALFFLDDAAWPIRKLRRPAAGAPLRPWPTWILAPVAVVLLVSSARTAFHAFRTDLRSPEWLWKPMAYLEPFQLVNSYGLFRSMTVTRPELTLEGSDDGTEWKPYEFKYKPGDLARRPAFVAPYMPRLDWQMWFAALGSRSDLDIVQRLRARLLEGSKPVLALLATNPFPDKPPRRIRVQLHHYEFTTPEEGRTTGNWWKKK